MSAQQPFPHPLADPLVDLIAQRFRVLAEPMRIKLLDRLREGDAGPPTWAATQHAPPTNHTHVEQINE